MYIVNMVMYHNHQTCQDTRTELLQPLKKLIVMYRNRGVNECFNGTYILIYKWSKLTCTP